MRFELGSVPRRRSQTFFFLWIPLSLRKLKAIQQMTDKAKAIGAIIAEVVCAWREEALLLLGNGLVGQSSISRKSQSGCSRQNEGAIWLKIIWSTKQQQGEPLCCRNRLPANLLTHCILVTNSRESPSGLFRCALRKIWSPHLCPGEATAPGL